jgi:adenosylcobinamide kinase/adenosylcobinamide-phosphate guanylyltransferase
LSNLILITGGARSGKSSFALELCEDISAERLFVATCPTIDSEMDDRVARHKQEREGRGWTTIEEPLNLKDIFFETAKKYDVILLDCITLWVNNILFSFEREGGEVNDKVIQQLAKEWLKTAKQCPGTVVCVTNEVGLGIVPENGLARKYRDLVGTVNQTIGKIADEVVLVSCGVPLYIKKK